MSMNIEHSIETILGRDEIITDLFYDIFLDRHPDVRQFFLGVNLDHQAVVLRMSLLLIEQHYRVPTPASRQYLRVLGHRHKVRQIPESLFLPFRDCLLETLERFHGVDWSEPLRREWSAAIDEAAKVILEGYHQPPRV
jgi:hemoglobin-like flavoprotein